MADNDNGARDRVLTAMAEAGGLMPSRFAALAMLTRSGPATDSTRAVSDLLDRGLLGLELEHDLADPRRDGALIITTAGWMEVHTLLAYVDGQRCHYMACAGCRPTRCAQCGYEAGIHEAGRWLAHASPDHTFNVQETAAA